jgi:hypothetical protein
MENLAQETIVTQEPVVVGTKKFESIQDVETSRGKNNET